MTLIPSPFLLFCLEGGFSGSPITPFPPSSPALLQLNHGGWWPAMGPSRWRRAAEVAAVGLAMVEGEAGASGWSTLARRSLSF